MTKTKEVQKKSCRFRLMKSKKYEAFNCKSGKLVVQLEDEYYKNGKNTQIQ